MAKPLKNIKTEKLPTTKGHWTHQGCRKKKNLPLSIHANKPQHYMLDLKGRINKSRIPNKSEHLISLNPNLFHPLKLHPTDCTYIIKVIEVNHAPTKPQQI